MIKKKLQEQAERRKAEIVQHAFDSYLDFVVERLIEKGLDSNMAIESIFCTVEHLGGSGVLPPFPEGDVSYREMGEWLVAADDFKFVDFMVEAVTDDA